MKDSDSTEYSHLLTMSVFVSCWKPEESMYQIATRSKITNMGIHWAITNFFFGTISVTHSVVRYMVRYTGTGGRGKCKYRQKRVVQVHQWKRKVQVLTEGRSAAIDGREKTRWVQHLVYRFPRFNIQAYRQVMFSFFFFHYIYMFGVKRDPFSEVRTEIEIGSLLMKYITLLWQFYGTGT